MNCLNLCRVISVFLLLSAWVMGSVGEARVGGGRSFGSRGSRGFSSPSRSYSNSPTRSYGGGSSNYSSTPPLSSQQPLGNSGFARPSLLKSLGAGVAGGLLGGMLFRSFGGGGMGGGMMNGMGGGGGIGLLEILLLGGVLFLVYKLFMKSRQSGQSSYPNVDSSSDGASDLMRRAKSSGWSGAFASSPASFSEPMDSAEDIQTDLATDLFFRVQGAWGNRDLMSIRDFLESDAKAFLEQEISHLKAQGRINRLENIAVRGVEVAESWEERGMNFSTVRYTANLLDFTVDERTQQVVEGSRTEPVKFEEYWTFSKNAGSSNWKLSAIQQLT